MHAIIAAKSKINAIAIPAVGPGATLQQSASLFAKHTSTDPESPQPLTVIVHQRSLSFSRKTRSAQFPSYASIPAVVHPQLSVIEKLTPGYNTDKKSVSEEKSKEHEELPSEHIKSEQHQPSIESLKLQG
jgi:hypothetical protein